MTTNISEYEAFQRRMTNLYVEHPEIERIWNRLDQNRWIKREGENSDDSPINLFIEGLSGVGKTQCAKKYVRKNPIITKLDEEGNEYDTRPVLYMKLPVPFTYKGFYNNILRSIDENFPISQLVFPLNHNAQKLTVLPVRDMTNIMSISQKRKKDVSV